MVAREISEQITLYTSKKCTPIYTNPRDFLPGQQFCVQCCKLSSFFEFF